jgi:hypothetical protein
VRRRIPAKLAAAFIGRLSMTPRGCWKVAAGIALVVTVIGRAGQEQWTTDYDQALVKAKAERKILFLNFTSMDDNATVRKFNAEILGHDTFYAYAKDHGMLLVDIIMGANKPKNPALKKQHRQAVKKYGVKKFPIVLIADADGRVVGELGYAAGGPGPFIAKLDAIIKEADSK